MSAALAAVRLVAVGSMNPVKIGGMELATPWTSSPGSTT